MTDTFLDTFNLLVLDTFLDTFNLLVLGILRNPSVILSLTLARNKKVEHYIRIKTHKLIVLRFWVESGVNALCGWAQVSLVCCISPMKPPL